MNKMEYMKQLENQLLTLSAEDRNEILRDFEEHFKQGLLEGKTEEEIARSLGDTSEWIEELKQYRHTTNKHQELIPIPNHGVNHIKIESVAANVIVGSSSDGQIHYELTDKKARVNIHNYYVDEFSDQDSLSLKVIQKQKKLFNFDAFNLTLKVEVPDSMKSVQITTVSGEIMIADLSSEKFDIQTTSGEIYLKQLNGLCVVKTVSGEIRCEAMKSNLSLKTVSGDIAVSDSFGDMIQAKTISGELGFTDCSLRMITFDTLSGDIEFEGVAENIDAKSKSGDISVSARGLQAFKVDSVSGDVDVNLLDCQGLSCVLKTVSGDVDLDLSVPYRYMRNLLKFGDESCASSIKTISGDITIKN